MIFRGKSDSGDVSFFEWYLFSFCTLRRSKGQKSEEEGKGGKTKKEHLYPHNFCLILIFKKEQFTQTGWGEKLFPRKIYTPAYISYFL